MKGDEEGNRTCIGGRGELVIDYVLAEEEVTEEVARLEIGDRVDSDHHPVVVWMKGGEYERRGRGRMKGRVCRGIWDEERREAFKEVLRRVELAEGSLQEVIKELGQRIKNTLERLEEKRKGEKKERKEWWNKECEMKKRKIRKALRKWRKGRRGGQEYSRERENIRSYVIGRKERRMRSGKEKQRR